MLLGKPVIRNMFQLFDDAADALLWYHAKRRMFVFEPAHRLTQPSSLPTFQREGTEIDGRIFTELHERQAEVRVAVQVFLPDLVKHRHAAEIVASFEKRTDDVGKAIDRADGIAQRHPRPALYAVHQKGLPRLVEQHGLVAEVDEVRNRRRLSRD